MYIKGDKNTAAASFWCRSGIFPAGPASIKKSGTKHLFYIIPGLGAGAGAGSFMVATAASVVRSVDATDSAF